MVTNSDCTIYNRIRSDDGDTWKRTYIPEVWWFDDTKSSITTDGMKSGNVLNVRIPDTSVSVKKDDVIIKGRCPVEIRSVKDLHEYEYYKVIKANYNLVGSNPHIKVVGA